MKHLAIVSSKQVLEQILSGEKTIEGRLSQDRIPPFGVVTHNDTILVKEKGGKITGQVTADNVLYYENITGEIIGKLRKQFGADMMVTDEFWTSHTNARFATIIFVKNPQRYLMPIKLTKHDRRPWVVL